MEPKQTSEVFAQEIAELEAKLQEKKMQMERAGSPAPEKNIFKEVVRDHAFAKEATTAPSATVTTTTAAPTTSTRLPTAAEEEAVTKHIAQAFIKGIPAAVREARSSGNPFLIDLLHDRLADEYYQKLLAARKVKAV